MAFLTQSTNATPATPASGYASIYWKSDKLLYWLDDAATERAILYSGDTRDITLSGSLTLSGSVKTGGSDVSALNSTATTLFDATLQGGYWVVAYLAGTSTTYYAEALVVSDGSSNATVLQTANGGGMTITASGHNVQGTQSTGGTATIRYRYLRLF